MALNFFNSNKFELAVDFWKALASDQVDSRVVQQVG